MAGRNFAQFIVNTTSQQATLDLLADYQPKLSEVFPEAYVKFKRLDLLEVPELEFRFYGDNLDSLHVAAERMMVEMRQMPELEWVHSDFLQPFPLINVELDPVASAQLGINRTTAALSLASQTGNLRVGSIWENDYELPIVVRDTTSLTISDVEDLPIASPFSMLSSIGGDAFRQALPSFGGVGGGVSLRQVANVSPKWSESRIMHRSGERCLTVMAEFQRGIYAAPVEARLAKMQERLLLPEGVRAELGGELEYNDQNMPQIYNGIIIAMIIIFFFLLFNFKRFGITTLCMVALGLMIPGTLVGLGIMNRMIGLTSIFGLITLMGMIMRNEILIYEHADNLLRTSPDPSNGGEGLTGDDILRQAAYDAGRRRMVPIFLTTATTAVGVIPMIIAGSSFWMPVGVTIFAGGIGTLILVVTVLPVLYWKLSTKK